MKRNTNNKFVKNEVPTTAGNSSGVPRRVSRNNRRMESYNETKSEEPKPGPPSKARPLPPRREYQQKGRFRKVAEQPVAVNSPTAPSTVPTYDGQSKGLTPICYVNSHNMDFSSFPIISRELYQMLISKDSTLQRSMPYCMFQHYLCTLLNATLIERVKLQNVDPRFMAEQDPFDIIHADSLFVPTPFLRYLNGIGANILQNGDKVHLNLPPAGTPQHSFTVGNVTVPSGTFGACNTQRHNGYECYVSPYVTRALINRTILVSGQLAPLGEWMPLPPEIVPNGAHATPNLLGYELPEVVHGDAVAVLQRFVFFSDASMAGRLCLCSDLMNTVSGLLSGLSTHFAISQGVPREQPINPAAFVCSRIDIEVQAANRLASHHGTLVSCENAGASAANMASYFGFKRERTELAPGYCLVAPNRNYFVNWAATINSNFTMAEPFNPIYGQDFQFLRSSRFVEAPITGSREANIRLWLEKDFALRK